MAAAVFHRWAGRFILLGCGFRPPETVAREARGLRERRDSKELILPISPLPPVSLVSLPLAFLSQTRNPSLLRALRSIGLIHTTHPTLEIHQWGEFARKMKRQKTGQRRVRELFFHCGSLGGALGFPPSVGLHTIPPLDLDSLECSSHRGRRSHIS